MEQGCNAMKQELTLRSLRPGERGRVRAMRVTGRSPLGDLTAYSLYGAVLALRDADSARIAIKRTEG